MIELIGTLETAALSPLELAFASFVAALGMVLFLTGPIKRRFDEFTWKPNVAGPIRRVFDKFTWKPYAAGPIRRVFDKFTWKPYVIGPIDRLFDFFNENPNA